MSMQSTAAAARTYGLQTVTVTQSLPDIERYEAYRRKTAAFEEWRQKLSRGDRLPRGRFFKGKLPGRKHMALDEFWLGNANKPYDLSQFKPFEALAFGYPPQPKVTADSLAMFQALEGVNSPAPGALAFMASAEAQACKPELESDMGAFSYTSVPLQGNCRWFVRRGDTVKYERGFRSKQDASDWINAFGERLDWRAGFTFRLKGDSTHMEIVNRQGDVAKA